jgi:hypothetical protein
VLGALHSAAPTLDGAPSTSAMQVEAPLLARLLATRKAELVRTTAAAAMLQERAASEQLEQAQRALPAPSEIAPERASANGTLETSKGRSHPRGKQRAWWRWW